MNVLLIRLSCLLMLLLASSASATSIDAAIDGLWQEFGFGADRSFGTGCDVQCIPSSSGNSEYAPETPWTFMAQEPLLLTVTDAYGYGDQFEVFDFDESIGTTPPVETTGAGCGSDPEDCRQDPLASSRSFSLDGGAHSLTIQVIRSAFGRGAAYFQLDTVPEPGAGALLFAGLLGLAGWRRARE